MRFLIALLLFALPLHAESVVLGLSQDEVAITTSFDGSEILIFGAVKREAPIPSGELGVIVTVAGPSEPVMVRRKDRRFGIWINTESVEVDAAPSFYAVASSAPVRDILSEVEDLRHRVSIPLAIRSVGAPMDIENATRFSDALIRIRKETGLFQVLESSVVVDDETLFRTRVRLPSALTEGDYSTRIFLTRDKSVVSSYETVIDVRKVGLERWLYQTSREQPFFYGIMSLAIAIAAGWLASFAFSLIRQ